MPKAKRDKPKTLSFNEFMANHGRTIEPDYLDPLASTRSLADLFKLGPSPATASDVALRSVKTWRPVQLLIAAAKERSPEPYRELLEYMLSRIGARPPIGVLLPIPGKPGAKRKPATDEAYLRWLEIGQPSLFTQKLAQSLFGKDFTKLDSKGKKRVVDKCRNSVNRRQQQIATESSRD